MIELLLLSATGEPVTVIPVPPFVNAPDAIVWGERIFARSLCGEYKEAFAFHVAASCGRSFDAVSDSAVRTL